MHDTVYQYGNTIRLECTFKDYGGVLVDPAILKIRIYDYRYTLIEEITTNIIKSDIGVYYYDYTTPKEEKRIYYEWYGEIDGSPSIKRDGFKIQFI